MKVLLLNPPTMEGIIYVKSDRCMQKKSAYGSLWPPITLAYIASLLRENGYEVSLADFMAEGLDFAHLEKYLREMKPDVVIINSSIPTIYNDILVAKMCKTVNNPTILFIGMGATILTPDFIDDKTIDYIIKGEPEQQCLNLIKRIEENKKSKRIWNVNGAFIENLDKLPFPARDMLPNEKYRLPDGKKFTTIISGRGCPYNCIFCLANRYYGKKFRRRSLENIIEEIEEVVGKYKIKNIMFWADTFTMDKEFVMRLSQMIIDKGLDIRWFCNSRVDTIDEEMLRMMRESGCWLISFGVESGDQKILNQIEKGTKIEQIKRTFEMTKKFGIKTIAHLILGLPGENENTIQNTSKLLEEINPDYIQVYSAIPYPGTELFKIASKKGWITTYDWSKYELNETIMNTPELSKEKLQKLRKEMILKFYIKPWNLKKAFEMFAPNPIPFIKNSFNFMKDWVKI